MDPIEILKKLIADHEEVVAFAPFGEGTDPSIVEAVEKRMGVVLPPSYKWWLNNYTGGYIGGNEVFSIYEGMPEDMPSGDIAYMRMLNLKSSYYKENELVVMENELDNFYFDLNQVDENGEYLIYDKMSGKVFAKDFIEFLIKVIRLHIG